jgi:hypothetical protein
MTDFITRYGEQLRAATPRKRRARIGRSAVIASVAALLVVAPTIAATRPWGPLIGDEHRGQPDRSEAPVAPAALAGLGVLRRAQQPSDRGELSYEALRMLDSNVDGVRTDGVRLLRGGDTDAVLIPVERFNIETSKDIPPSLVPATKGRLSLKSEGFCVYVPDPKIEIGGGEVCLTWDAIRAGAMPSSIGNVVFGLVPDGVSSVRVHVRGAAPVEATVRDNFYAGTSRSVEVLSVEWRDVTGRVTNTVEQDPAEAPPSLPSS